MDASWLLACDMDGTVIPLDPDPRHRRGLDRLRDALARTSPVVLAYLSGRHLDLALAGIREHALPVPRALACDVGTSLYWRRSGRWEIDPEYRRGIRVRMGGLGAEDVDAIVRGIGGLRSQPEERQGEFKRSYFVEGRAIDAALQGELRERLDHAGVRARVVISRDPVDGRGLLDVLPEGVAKETALQRIQTTQGIPPERTLFAGDSGNDLSALLSGCRGVLVGNADAKVREELRRQADERGLGERICLATEPYAEGVLEGVAHHGLPLARPA